MQARYALAILIAVGLGTACNSGDFAGGTQKKATTKAAAKKDPIKGSPTLDANSNPNNSKNNGSDGSDGADGADGADVLGNARPGSPSDDGGGGDDGSKFPSTTGSNGDTGNSNIGSDFSKSLIDILGSAVQVTDDVIVNQPNDNEIEFGGAKVFRLGDSNAGQSSCLSGISAYTVAGKKYAFEFEVKKDDTRVTVDIGRICGVDYGDTNFVSFAKGGSVVGTPDNLPRGATSYSFVGATLKAGTYAFVVESRKGSTDTTVGEVDPDDYDDYIIGKVKIKANKQIRPGKVGAQ